MKRLKSLIVNNASIVQVRGKVGLSVMGYKLGHKRESVAKATKGLGKASAPKSPKGNSAASPPKIHVRNSLK